MDRQWVIPFSQSPLRSSAPSFSWTLHSILTTLSVSPLESGCAVLSDQTFQDSTYPQKKSHTPLPGRPPPNPALLPVLLLLWSWTCLVSLLFPDIQVTSLHPSFAYVFSYVWNAFSSLLSSIIFSFKFQFRFHLYTRHFWTILAL